VAISEEQARNILANNERYLQEQPDVEDFAVALNDRGEVVIEIASPDPLPGERQQALQEHLGTDVPIEFRRPERGKMAY
jgi:hypothetical protein